MSEVKIIYKIMFRLSTATEILKWLFSKTREDHPTTNHFDRFTRPARNHRFTRPISQDHLPQDLQNPSTFGAIVRINLHVLYR